MSSISSDLGIPVKINLAGVGANFQDQFNNVLYFASNTTFNITGIPQAPFGTYVAASVIFGDTFASVADQVRKYVPTFARQIASSSAGTTTKDIQERLLNLQVEPSSTTAFQSQSLKLRDRSPDSGTSCRSRREAYM